MIYNALIIGAGSIGALKPDNYDSPEGKDILTHAHAYYANKKIYLVGIVDKNIDKALDAGKKWNTFGFDSITAAYEGTKYNTPIHIISICTPDETHLSVLEKIIPFQPKVVIMEKPVGRNISECRKIINLCKKHKIALMVDYIRRYEMSVNIIREDIIKKEAGEIYSCVVYYDRGLIRDGSHAIDLMNYWFGRFLGGHILPGKVIIDYTKEDPSFSVFLSYERCKSVFLIPSDGRKFSIFDTHLTTETGKFVYGDHGRKLGYYSIVPEKTYGNYNSLATEPIKFITDLTYALNNVIKEAVDYINKKIPLRCTGEDALKVHRVIEHLKGGRNE